MTEKSFPLGNFLIKLNCKFVSKQVNPYYGPVMSAIYTLGFWTQDSLTCIAEIPMSSEVFLNIVDIFRWNGIDGAFMYAFPPCKLFEQYTLCIGYMDETMDIPLDQESPVIFNLFKMVGNKEDEILEIIVTEYEFEQFVEFLLDYSFCAEGFT